MKKIFAVMAVLLSVTTSAQAKDWSISGLVGYGVGENSFSGLTFGAQVNYMLSPDWSAGVYWSSTTDSSFTKMPIMAQASYHFADMKGLYVGPRVGITSMSTPDITILGITVPGASTTEFTVGAQLGYDFELATDWSLGLQANWNLIMATSSSSLFNFVVPVTYHF